MVAGGNVAKDPPAVVDRERGTTMLAAADEHVIDRSKRPVGVSDQRVLIRRERRRAAAGMHARPRISVADTDTSQRLAASPEPQARRIRVGIEVTGDEHVPGQLLQTHGGVGRLALALELLLGLPARK